MSRIGKQIIEIPKGIKVEQKGLNIKATGPLGNIQMDRHPLIKVKIDESAGTISVENKTPDNRQAKQLHGTMRALISNMITGVSKGYEKKMEIFGTGYNVKEQGGNLVLQVGFCHPVQVAIPKSVKVTISCCNERQ